MSFENVNKEVWKCSGSRINMVVPYRFKPNYTRYNWDIVESDIKHQGPPPNYTQAIYFGQIQNFKFFIKNIRQIGLCISDSFLMIFNI